MSLFLVIYYHEHLCDNTPFFFVSYPIINCLNPMSFLRIG